MKAQMGKIELWQIEKVKPYEKNAKKHDDDQVARIAKSIEMGWDQPIVVDKDGVIIKGHGRRLAAMKLGFTHVPVLVRSDLSEEQVKVARLADNRVALGDIDTNALRLEMEEINSDLLKGIFDDKELENLNADMFAMNADAFIDDLDSQINEQERELANRILKGEEKVVALSKAFGIKGVKVANQIHITRFMARAEAETGLKGEDALVTYCQKVMA